MADANGIYRLAIEIDGYSCHGGHMSIIDHQMRGGDDCYEIEGRAHVGGSTIDATLNVTLRTGASGHPFIKHPFAMTASGLLSAQGFELLGLGPLGAIVLLRGTEQRPPPG